MSPRRLDGLLAVLVAAPFVLGAATAPTPTPDEVFAFTDPAIVESSGLAVLDGLFVTVNDSGDSGRVFAVDPASGDTVGVTRWDAEPTDDEALAPAPDGTVWVGDIGDNRAARDEVVVRRVPVGRGERAVSPPSYRLVYPDGAHDAETLLCDPSTGRLYVATKGVLGGTLFAAPADLNPGVNPLTPVGPVLGVATDGAFFPDGRHVIVRDYGRAAVYTMPDLSPVGSFDLPSQEQGEGIAVAADGQVFVSSEGAGAPVLRVDLPGDVAAAVAGNPSASPTETPTESPSATGAAPPRTVSREESELPERPASDRSPWPWLLTGSLGVVALLVLLRSMRRR